MARAFVRSVEALRDVSVRLVEDSLQIGLNAYKGFTPSAFQGVVAVLDIMTDDGPREVRGSLAVIKTSIPRGAWYKYLFVPEKPHEIFFILDWDSLWSNVRAVRLVSPHGSRVLNNLFYREPFVAVPV